jgi:hypothetical protein
MVITISPSNGVVSAYGDRISEIVLFCRIACDDFRLLSPTFSDAMVDIRRTCIGPTSMVITPSPNDGVVSAYGDGISEIVIYCRIACCDFRLLSPTCSVAKEDIRKACSIIITISPNDGVVSAYEDGTSEIVI